MNSLESKIDALLTQYLGVNWKTFTGCLLFVVGSIVRLCLSHPDAKELCEIVMGFGLALCRRGRLSQDHPDQTDCRAGVGPVTSKKGITMGVTIDSLLRLQALRDARAEEAVQMELAQLAQQLQQVTDERDKLKEEADARRADQQGADVQDADGAGANVDGDARR